MVFSTNACRNDVVFCLHPFPVFIAVPGAAFPDQLRTLQFTFFAFVDDPFFVRHAQSERLACFGLMSCDKCGYLKHSRVTNVLDVVVLSIRSLDTTLSMKTV